MAALTLVTADRLRIVESLVQMTLPAGEAIAAGNEVAIDSTTGRFVLASGGNAYGTAPRTVGAGVALTAIRQGVLAGFDLSGLSYGDKVYQDDEDIVDTAVAAGGTNEQQTITIVGSPSGGTFTLTFAGQTTAAIAYNATANAIEEALEALSTIGAGNISVIGASPAFTVEFIGELANTNVAEMTADGASLTGDGDEDVTIATTQAGAAAASELATDPVGMVVPGTAEVVGSSYAKLLFVEHRS